MSQSQGGRGPLPGESLEKINGPHDLQLLQRWVPDFLDFFLDLYDLAVNRNAHKTISDVYALLAVLVFLTLLLLLVVDAVLVLHLFCAEIFTPKIKNRKSHPLSFYVGLWCPFYIGFWRVKHICMERKVMTPEFYMNSVERRKVIDECKNFLGLGRFYTRISFEPCGI